MSDDTPTPDGTEPDGGKADFEAITSQEDFDKRIQARLARERSKFADYDDVKAKAAEFDKSQEASKTEVQKATERAEKAEADLAAIQSSSLRSEVALAKGLTPTQAKRLVGSTREELEADADELLADLGDQKPSAPRAPQQKTKQTEPKNDPEREFARQLFGRAD